MQPMRRVGMQPPAKRPAPPREMVNAVQMIPQGPTREGVESSGDTLTDEQLDSLLGDVDVDAMIAASRPQTFGRNMNTMVVGSGDSSNGRKTMRDNASVEVGRQFLVGRAQGGETVQQPEMPIVNERGTQGISYLEQIQQKGSEENAEPASAAADQEAMEAETRVLSKEDAAMIDSLLEGLDGSDFL